MTPPPTEIVEATASRPMATFADGSSGLLPTQTQRGPDSTLSSSPSTFEIMEKDDSVETRIATVRQVIDTPPAVHLAAPGGVWATASSCYDFMANHVRRGSRTLETGAGISTVLFAAWRCDHLAVVPDPSQAKAIQAYCVENGIDTDTLTFDLRPSEVALPDRADSGELDLVFIDGCHGFPLPIIDWFYGAGRLREKGVVVFDDVQLPQVSLLIQKFIEPDDRWEELKKTPKWRAYRRMSEGFLGEEWSNQPFFPATLGNRAMRTLKDHMPLSVRKKLRDRF